jgi:ribosomal protein S18 acetylase RimI-like enzyme
MSLHLRTPIESDIPRLAKLGRDTFIETFGPLYSEKDLQSFLTEVYSDATVAQELADPTLTHQVIEHQDDLIGFAKIGPVHLPIENPAPGAMEIWQIYLRQEFLGQGLGELLLTWALDQLTVAGASEIYLSVFSENDRAIRFYQKHHFQKCGEYGFPVGDQIDQEWIMRRTAQPS